jgi:hypothetical protein
MAVRRQCAHEMVDRQEQCVGRLKIEEKNLRFNNLPVRPRRKINERQEAQV